LGTVAGRRAADDLKLVRGAMDLGVCVFDTADVYGCGASERVLGRAIRGRRDEVVIATKGGFVFRDRSRAEQFGRRWAKPVFARIGGRPVASEGGPPAQFARQDFSSRYLRSAVHASLRRLRTDRIDLYQFHAPPQVLPDVVAELADLAAIGDVRRFGVGAQSAGVADAWVTVPGISAVQVPFGILDPEAAASTLPLASAHGREVWARGVFGGGFLSLAERDPAADAVRSKRELIEALRRTAHRLGLDRYQLALGFVRAHVGISTILIGTTSLAHLQRNAALLLEPPLEPEVVQSVIDCHASGPTVEERG
jgi:aryl-alcohol dehydrogenase-like predicted oxidoreductase